MYFGKIKGTNDEWGFDVFKSTFDSYKEVTDDKHSAIIAQANQEQKRIVGDKDGNPILVDYPPPTEEETRQNRINELESYLKSTDWYAIRYADSGVEVPAEIKKERQSAREEISVLRERTV